MLESLDILIGFVVIILVVSLLITVLVQMISSVLNLRGWDLAKGLGFTLGTAVPGAPATLMENAKGLANYILKLPQISDRSRFLGLGKGRATAVRAQEVFAILQGLAKQAAESPAKDGTIANPSEAAYVAKKVLALYQTEEMQNAAQVVGSAVTALEAIGNPQVDAAIAQLKAEKTKVDNAVVAAAGDAVVAWKRFQFWFEAGQDRAQQWFASKTRLITMILAVVAAFGLQLDTVEIFRRVSTDQTLRDKLVASAGVVTEQAEKTLADTPSVLQSALTDWRANLKKPVPAPSAPAANSPSTPAPDQKPPATPAEIYKTLNPELQKAVEELKPESQEARGDLIARLETALTEPANSVHTPKLTDERKALLVKSFEDQIDAEVHELLKQYGKDFAAINKTLEDSGFQLFVTTKGGRWAHEIEAGHTPACWPVYCWPVFFRHCFGMFFTACLLTLGAPFWFNSLKSLTALRSLVARDISAEEQKNLEKAKSTNVLTEPPPQ